MHSYMIYFVDEIHNTLIHRSTSGQPVSPVLSSQVTAISDTSSNFAVELTFQYSINVSNSVCAATCITMTIHCVL